MNQPGARAFLIVFTLLTLLQLIQQIFHPIKLAGLQGAFDVGTKPVFSTEQWFKGVYQQEVDYYLKYNTAFNGELVRLRNQLDYSVFGNINTVLTLGKENYIFDPNYIAALNGRDLLNDSAFDNKVHAIENTLSILDAIHVPLYVCFAPNKASFYNEYLPEQVARTHFTNLNFFDSLLKQHHIPVINYDNYFLSLKDTAEYPLMPQYGAHWSTYGAYYAADTLLKRLYLENIKEFASFSLNKIELSDNARFTDDDYLASLNLMKKWKSPPMAYPQLKFRKGKKPTVLIISDSFIWNFYDLGIIPNCFSARSQIRYYNKTIYDSSKNNLGPANNITNAELRQCDIIIILSSEPSLKDFGFGFFESVAKLTRHE